MSKVLSAGTATQSRPRCPFLSSWVFENEAGLRDFFVRAVRILFLFVGVVSSD